MSHSGILIVAIVVVVLPHSYMPLVVVICSGWLLLLFSELFASYIDQHIERTDPLLMGGSAAPGAKRTAGIICSTTTSQRRHKHDANDSNRASTTTKTVTT
jgi:hypothetical protein